MAVYRNNKTKSKAITSCTRFNTVAALLLLTLHAPASGAEPLIKSLPSQQYNIPAGDLAQSLTLYAGYAGVLLSFDSSLTKLKTTPGLKGSYSVSQGFDELLRGSGLEVYQAEGGRYQLRKAAVMEKDKLPGEKSALDVKVDAIEVRAKRFYEIGPLPGLGLTKEEIPGNVQSLTAKDIKESNSLSITDLMNSRLQSVNVNDYQGNPFQMDVQYRGFTAGPQIGTPQGLSVFIDGIRVNEPFGDVVNWDMLPLNALASFDVFPGSNPIFGLGTLGGALSMKTKDGFSNTGANAEVLTGSFGRRQLQAEGGWNNGTVAGFAAANIFLEDGWRDNSPSRVNQVFGKGSYRGDKLDLNLSTLIVWNDLVGNGMLPSEMYKQDRNGVFTSPDTTDNRLWQLQLSGSYFVNDHFTITSQVYTRNSKRNTKGADVYTEHNGYVRRALNTGEQYTCLFNSTNGLGLPDYYVFDVPNNDWSQSAFFNEYFSNGMDAQAAINAIGAAVNPSLTGSPEGQAYLAHAQSVFNTWKNYRQAQNYQSQGNYINPELEQGPANPITGEANWNATIYNSINFNDVFGLTNLSDPFTAAIANYYYTADGTKHVILVNPPSNLANCIATQATNFGNDPGALSIPDPDIGGPLAVDGANTLTGRQPGVVNGTPTAIFTDTQIDQETDGASIQFNWNFDKHKFMVGASVDMPSASYTSGQMLGMLDAQRRGYLAPDQIREQYAAASLEVNNNDFKGHQITKSIYASETWSPIETLNFTGALRYNETRGKNKIASRTWGSRVFDLSDFEAVPDEYDLCVNGVCPTTGYQIPDLSRLKNPAETEKFSYYSLNPSLGATWQATPKLNLYGNWAQGTRTPSVIELGCAFDSTPVEIGGGLGTMPRSLAQNRSCSLPTTLSGDPYLPQIKAQTWDFGMRGHFNDNIEWNLGIYRTDLKDDIYMIGYPGNRNFFDTIGETRRQGLEAGINAAFDKWRLRLNYALTEATFQDSFWMPANDNSSAVEEFIGNLNYSRRIQVNPGNRMPGVPLHNLNATLSYQVTPKWQIGMTAVAHSFAYVRGNENNQHQEGVTIYETYAPTGELRPRRPTNNPGTVDGYMVLNMQTSYKLNSEWTLGLRVNNILDKEYFNAGRLGRNPFSPSVYGAIGPDGYNHNSNDWLTTNFLAPGAPRAAWVSLSYEFDPRK